MSKLGILVGGGPAPGINGVICAATILARRRGVEVVGILDGFNWLMQGNLEHVRELEIAQISRIHQLGGSILRTSRANPSKNPEDLGRVADSLQRLGVDNLVTIGGDDTCYSARRVAETVGEGIRVAHVPKTIDNDLPLPNGIVTFGYETARGTAASIVSTLMEDARTTGRWYIAVVMGRTAGHLALGAAKSAGATCALVAEEFEEGPIRLGRIARIVEGSIVKRLAMGRPYGVVVVAEGIGERLDSNEADLSSVPRDEHGHLRLAELPLGSLIANRVREGLSEVGVPMTLVSKDIGYELRCAPPNAFDQDYTRDLGAGAAQFVLEGGRDAMITRQDRAIVPIPFSEILDPETGKTRVRLLRTDSPSYGTARIMQVRMEPEDFSDPEFLAQAHEVTGLDEATLRERYHEG